MRLIRIVTGEKCILLEYKLNDNERAAQSADTFNEMVQYNQCDHDFGFDGQRRMYGLCSWLPQPIPARMH
jgi:hypothetical protein